MPTMPVVVTPIETYMPSADARNDSKVHVVDGKNFLFDSEGPKSGFGSNILTPFPISAPLDLQGLVVQDQHFVFTQDSILSWRTKTPIMWDMVLTFAAPIPLLQRGPWTGAYLDGTSYFSQKYRGFYSARINEVTERLVFTSETSDSIPGLLEEIQGLAVVRNRMIMVNSTTIQWSNTGDMTDLTPALEGAGFQFIETFTKGSFVAITEFEDGFVVWTTLGSVVAEYIGGPAVWRWYPGTSLERPIGPGCVARLSTGVHVILSAHGLFIAQSGKDPEAWTPEFNEFLMKYIATLQRAGIKWRLEYDESRQTIYIMESNNNLTYWRSFVLTPTRNKWGIFSKEVYGILPFASHHYGWVGLDKIPRYLNDGFFELDAPAVELGYDRHYPRLQKSLPTPSSSVVSRAITYDPQVPYSFGIDDYPAASWYAPNSTLANRYSLGGLDSWIQIGYVTPANLSESIDALAEIQEIVYGSTPEAAPVVPDWTSTYNGSAFYPEEEDWDWDGLIGWIDDTEDYNIGGSDVDYSSESGPTEDLLYSSIPVFDDTGVIDEDWNDDGEEEDWGSPISHLNPLSAKLTIQSSQDGRSSTDVTPYLARFDTEARTMTLMTSGSWHTVLIQATEAYEYYHVRYLGFTFEYGGQLV